MGNMMMSNEKRGPDFRPLILFLSFLSPIAYSLQPHHSPPITYCPSPVTYRFILINSSNIWSVVVMTRAFAE